jgi:methionyl-tRNA formyltransferase|tara:strand:- start:1714 stop:2385 length:672 start_codon:yes stop_codon:yes gene_type:complete
MKKNIIASSTKYIKIIVSKNNVVRKNFHFINDKKKLTVKNLSKINPKYIFFPHWRHKIPENIYKKYDCIGFHSTPLPYGRGGSPIQNMIVKGFKKTKICALKITKTIDAGPIYLKREMSLKGNGEEIMFRMNKIILSMIKIFTKKRPKPREQAGKVTFFRRRKPIQSKISFKEKITKIYDQIRMVDIEEYPKAYIDFKKYKIILEKPTKYKNFIKCSAIINKK